MTPYQKAWLGGSAFVGALGFVLQFIGASLEARQLAFLCGVMVVRSCYFAFASERVQRIEAETRNAALCKAASEAIGQAMAISVAVRREAEDAIAEAEQDLERLSVDSAKQISALTRRLSALEHSGNVRLIESYVYAEKLSSDEGEPERWLLDATVYVTPPTGADLVIPEHACTARVYTDSSRAEFFSIDIVDRNGNLLGGDIRLDRARELRLIGSVKVWGIEIMQIAQAQGLDGEITLRDAADLYQATIPIRLDYVQSKRYWCARHNDAPYGITLNPTLLVPSDGPPAEADRGLAEPQRKRLGTTNGDEN